MSVITKPKVCVSLRDYSELASDGDWAPALERALGEADEVVIPEGVYRLSPVVIPSGKTISGQREATVLRPVGDRLFTLQGRSGGEIRLKRDKEDFSNSFALEATCGLEPGDLVYILGQRNYIILEDAGKDWCLGRSFHDGRSFFFGEYLTVRGIDGDRVTTTGGTIFPYYYADGSREGDQLPPKESAVNKPFRRDCTTVRKITPVAGVVIRNLTVFANGGVIIYAERARNCRFEGLSLLTDEDRPARGGLVFIAMRDCLDCEAANCSCRLRGGMEVKRDAELTMSSYMLYKPYLITACQRCGFDGCRADGASQGFVLAKAHGSGPTIDCYVKNSEVKNSLWSGIYLSQGTFRNTASGNKISGCATGISVAGRKSVIRNNHIDINLPFETRYVYVRPEEGGTAGVMINEGYGIDSVLSGNVIRGAHAGVLMRDGYEETNIFTHGGLTIENNDITECKNGFLMWKNKFHLDPVSMDIKIKNNVIRGIDGASKCGITVPPGTEGVTAENNIISGFENEICAPSEEGATA